MTFKESLEILLVSHVIDDLLFRSTQKPRTN